MLVSTNDVIQAQRTCAILSTEFLFAHFICELLLFLWLWKHQIKPKLKIPKKLKAVGFIQLLEPLVNLEKFFP